ncbi:MAG: trypsin-like peptidase domain-containing protein [Streptosporangiaceae bacterium]
MSRQSGVLPGRRRPLPRWTTRPVRRAALPAVVLVLAAGVAACSSASASGSSASGSASQLQSQYEHVVDHVLPSVVQITTSNSTGSGVVYDSSGDIVTNAHVIGTATSVMVREPVGNEEMSAKVIGTFPPDDLAVIRVQGHDSGLKPAAFANSDDVQVGQIVLAMGNPLGLTDSVTQGIVSATGRTVGEGSGSNALITAAIQTSAAINPGNSGGALVNLSDQVVGIPTLAAQLPGQGGAAPGIGFAIPSDTVHNIAGQLIKDGRVTKSDRAAIGITGETAANASGDGVGVSALAVTSGGTAAQAGVRPGDVIVGLNGQRIATLDELQFTLARLTPGTKVTIHYTSGDSSPQRSGTGTLGSLSGPTG